jgi:hypothetical protein
MFVTRPYSTYVLSKLCVRGVKGCEPAQRDPSIVPMMLQCQFLTCSAIIDMVQYFRNVFAISSSLVSLCLDPPT